MKTTLFVSIFLLAACANPPVENVPVPPPTPVIESRPPTNQPKDEAADKFLRDQVEKKEETSRAVPTNAVPTNDAASDRFLFEEILRREEAARFEERRRAEEAARAQPQTVERTVYVDRYASGSYAPPSASPYGPYRPATFPVGTLLGGTVGGIIGNQSHHTAQGIAIGAGAGLLLDILAGGHR
jgi:hypothetical protein